MSERGDAARQRPDIGVTGRAQLFRRMQAATATGADQQHVIASQLACAREEIARKNLLRSHATERHRRDFVVAAQIDEAVSGIDRHGEIRECLLQVGLRA